MLGNELDVDTIISIFSSFSDVSSFQLLADIITTEVVKESYFLKRLKVEIFIQKEKLT